MKKKPHSSSEWWQCLIYFIPKNLFRRLSMDFVCKKKMEILKSQPFANAMFRHIQNLIKDVMICHKLSWYLCLVFFWLVFFCTLADVCLVFFFFTGILFVMLRYSFTELLYFLYWGQVYSKPINKSNQSHFENKTRATFVNRKIIFETL